MIAFSDTPSNAQSGRSSTKLKPLNKSQTLSTKQNTTSTTTTSSSSTKQANKNEPLKPIRKASTVSSDSLPFNYFDKKPSTQETSKKPATVSSSSTSTASKSADNKKPQLKSSSDSSDIDLPDSSRNVPDTKNKPAATASSSATANNMAAKEERSGNKQWNVKVYTSDLEGVSFEGTDAKVFVQLIGSLDESDKIVLDKSKLTSKTSKDLFEAGQCDEFVVSTDVLGKLQKIRIGHDNSGIGSGWHCNRVEIKNQLTGTTYTFPCNNWLSKDEGDKKIERLLDNPTVVYLNASSPTSDTTSSSNSNKKPTTTTANKFNNQLNKSTDSSDTMTTARSNNNNNNKVTASRITSGQLISQINNMSSKSSLPDETKKSDKLKYSTTSSSDFSTPKSKHFFSFF